MRFSFIHILAISINYLIKSDLKLSLLGLHAHCLQSSVPPGSDLIELGVVLLNAARLVLVTLNCALLSVEKGNILSWLI